MGLNTILLIFRFLYYWSCLFLVFVFDLVSWGRFWFILLKVFLYIIEFLIKLSFDNFDLTRQFFFECFILPLSFLD